MKILLCGIRSLVALSLLVGYTANLRALDINNFLEERHDRFYQPDPGEPAKAFIGDPGVFWQTGLDLSGVARVYDPTSPKYETWVTMISETHYMAVAHSRRTDNNPFSQDTLTFYRDNDLNGESWTLSPELDGNGNPINIAEEVFVAGDFYIGKLRQAPPAWVKRYPLLKRPEDLSYNYFGHDEVDSKIAVVGKADGDDFPVSSQQNLVRVGLREIQSYDSKIYHTNQMSDSNLIPDSTTLPGGDSGAPSFYINDTFGVALVGNHTNANSDMSISARLNDILHEVAQANETVTIVTDLVGDVNYDFKVDLLDLDIVGANSGTGQGYNQGDINGDGAVDLLDLDILGLNYGSDFLLPTVDFNTDNAVDHLDFEILASNWGQSNGNGDANGDGTVDSLDVEIFDNYWLRPDDLVLDVPNVIPGDADLNGVVGLDDFYILTSNLGPTSNASNPEADFNQDGQIDLLDLDIWGTNLQDIFADVNGDGLVDIHDVTFITHSSRWNTATLLGRDGGDLDIDGDVDIDDLALLATWWRYGYSSSDRGYSIPSPEPSALLLLSVGMSIYCSGYRKRVN